MERRPRSARPAATAALVTTAALVGLTALTGCASDVPMDAAVNANDPACASVIVRLPDSVAGLERRYTNAQSTGAWGTPPGVQLQCGVEPSGPTTDSCVNVDGIDWIIDDSQAPLYRFEAYGRDPGLAVFVNSELASGTEAVLDLGAAVQELPQTRQCIGLVDTLDLGQ